MRMRSQISAVRSTPVIYPFFSSTFIDGYGTPAANRTEFPLSGGFFTLNSEHPQWTSQFCFSLFTTY